MQIETIKRTQYFNQKPIMTKIKQVFNRKLNKLKTLVKDIFICQEQNYIIIDGKKIKEKDLPNSVTGPSDIKGITWGELEFYPEDLEKMKKMKTARERINYKKRLIEQRHFYENGIL